MKNIGSSQPESPRTNKKLRVLLLIGIATSVVTGIGGWLYSRPEPVIQGILSNEDQASVRNIVTREMRRPATLGFSWASIKDAPRRAAFLVTARISEIEVLPSSGHPVHVKTMSCLGPYFYYVEKGPEGWRILSKGPSPQFYPPPQFKVIETWRLGPGSTSNKVTYMFSDPAPVTPR